MRRMKISMILKFAFLAAIPLYALCAFLVTKNHTAPLAGSGDVNLLAAVLAIVCAVSFVLAPIVASRVGGNLPPEQASNSRFIVRAAIYEAGAIYGLVLSFMSRDPMYSVYFGIPAFLLILLAPT